MNLNYLIDDVIEDWFYAHPHGYATKPYNSQDLTVLREILTSKGYSTQLIENTIDTLSGNNQISESKRDASLNTAMMETAACIGIGGISISKIDPLLNLPSIFKKKIVKKQKDVEDYIAQCKNVVKITTTALAQLKFGSGDWDGSGTSIIEGLKLPTFDVEQMEFHENSIQDIALCCALAKGMSIYCSKVIGSDAKHFIHAGIKDFYSVEKARGLTR